MRVQTRQKSPRPAQTPLQLTRQGEAPRRELSAGALTGRIANSTPPKGAAFASRISVPLRGPGTKAGANEHCGALLRPERWCLQAPDGAVHYRSTAVSNPPSALSGMVPRGIYTSRGAVECHQSLLMSPFSKGETGLGTLSAVTHHCPFVGRFKLRFTRAVDGVPDSSSGRAYARLASPTPPQYPLIGPSAPPGGPAPQAGYRCRVGAT